MPRPNLDRVPQWYHGYINLVEGKDLLPAMESQTISFAKFLKKLPEAKRDYRYAKGKWTIKEMLQHIIDAERVFAYRALCFARKEAHPLPSFDENEYADNSKAAKRDWNDMVKEWVLARQSNEVMFRSFDKAQLDTTGIASGKPVYVLAIGFIMVGHINHHVRILNERYL